MYSTKASNTMIEYPYYTIFILIRTMSLQEQGVNPVECQVINIDLLNQHIKSVVDHFSKFHSEGAPLGEHTIKKHHGISLHS